MPNPIAAPTRRRFLRSAPLAAASLALAPELLAQTTTTAASPVPYQLHTAAQLALSLQTLQAKPGNDNLFAAPQLPFTIVLTVEEHKAAKEFEWHEGRDHILQVISGATTYQLGGTPQNAHSPRPGEWLAPASTAAQTIELSAGDLLIIPRGTPHKRTTADSVTFTLISTTGR